MAGFDEERVTELLGADPYAAQLGVELISVSSAEIVVGMEVRPEHLNFLGVGHGGVMFSLADCAFSLASNSAGDRAVAIDTHLVLTAGAGEGDRLEARVHEVSRGRTLGTYRAEIARGDGKVAGLFTGTVYIS